jgi:hypothetical protein
MRANAHAVPELPLAARAAIEVDGFARRANVLVLHAALQLAAALLAVRLFAGSGGRLLLDVLILHENSFNSGVIAHAC